MVFLVASICCNPLVWHSIEQRLGPTAFNASIHRMLAHTFEMYLRVLFRPVRRRPLGRKFFPGTTWDLVTHRYLDGSFTVSRGECRTSKGAKDGIAFTLDVCIS
jgi:hypothetical protein